VFLGRPREPGLVQARDAGPWERWSLAALAAACVLLGLLPVPVLRALEPVAALLVGEGIGAPLEGGWLFLAPVSAQRASYSPLLFLAVIAAAIAGAWLLVRHAWRGCTRLADPWDCGFPAQTARMQDSAEGFGQPVKQIFEPFFRIEREVPDPFDEAPRYAARTSDRLWHWLYLPVAAAVARLSSLLAPLQHGRMHLYLVYSFATLLFLLLVIRA